MLNINNNGNVSFYYKSYQYQSIQITSNIDVSFLRGLVKDSFYNIIGSLDMIALALIFLSDNDLLKKENNINEYYFTVERIYPYFMSYYQLNKHKKNYDLNDYEGISKFTNFSLSFIENVINCRSLALSEY